MPVLVGGFMKICLINPPHLYLKEPNAQAPLGLLYVAASLKSRNYELEFLDLSNQVAEVSYKIPEADIFGITGTVLDRVACSNVAKHIKSIYPKAKVIIGGPISLTPEYVAGPEFDSVVVGEGEHIIFELLSDYPNLSPVYRAARIENLDSIPFPARELIQNIGGNIFSYNKNYSGDTSSVIITSRGCPFNCAFCASPGIWNRRVRFRSIKNVIQEVDELINKFNVHQLRFSDDTLVLSRSRIKELSQELGKRPVFWRASIRTKPNDVELFKMLYDSGCREVSFGIESGDPDVLKFLNKSATVSDNKRAIENAKKAGLVVKILFMINTPGESEKTVDKNIAFLQSIDYDTVSLTQFIPMPGSAIFNAPEKFDTIILDKNIDHYNFYLHGPGGVREWSDFIKLQNTSQDILRLNRERMKNFVISTGKSNRA